MPAISHTTLSELNYNAFMEVYDVSNKSQIDNKLASNIKRTLRISIFEGSFTQVFLNWTSGSVLIGYMLYLDASTTEIGLVASVPLLAQMISPLAAWLAGIFGNRKYLTILTATMGRGLWLLAAVLPQLAIPDSTRSSVLVALVLLSSIFQSGTGTLWADWMGEVVPERQRGRYFGFRSGVVGVVGMIANLVAGWFLDQVAPPISFQTVLIVSIFSAAIGIFLYTLHYEPATSGSPLSIRETFNLPLREPNFRRFLSFAVYWQFSVLLAAPFVFLYFIDQLKMSFSQIALWSVIASSTSLITTTQWGRVADRFGNKVVLAIGTFLAGIALPLNWILAGLTGELFFIWLSAIFDALAWGAIGPAIFNLALVSAPKTNRVAFIAMYSLVTGMAGFIGGLLSGPLLTLLTPLEFSLGSMRWTGYHWLFLISGLARSQAWRLVRLVKETSAWRTRDVLKEIRFAWRGIGFPWR